MNTAPCYGSAVPLDTDKIKTLRIKLGLSMQQAADAVGFSSRQTWYSIESGRQENVTLLTLENMAKALGVKARDLLK